MKKRKLLPKFGVTSLVLAAFVSSSFIFSASSIYAGDSVNCSTTPVSHNNQVEADEQDIELSELLADAQLLLRATSVTAPWNGETWVNEGTLGSAYNAVNDALDNGVQAGVPAEHDADYPTGAGFIVVGDNPNHLNEYGFRIANNSIFDIPNSGARTFTFDTTPLDHTDSQYKVAWKYTGIALPTFDPGWVLEHNDDIGGGPGSGGLLMVEYDGVAPIGQINQGNVGGRQTLTVRIDRDANLATVWRNGILLSSITGNDISTLGDATSTSDLLLAKGNVFHNVAVHNRGLSDAEILELHQELSAL